MNLENLLSHLQGVTGSGSQYTAQCPAHDDRHNSLSVTEKDGKILLHCHAGCPYDEVVKALGLRPEDLFEDDRPEPARTEAPTEYLYPDENGGNYLKKVRSLLPDGRKTFCWYRWEDGTWKKGKGGRPTPLYNQACLKDGNPYVFFPEGEKDVNTLRALKFNAVSLSDGAAGHLPEEAAELFCGKCVTLLPDNDEPGRSYARGIAEALYGIAEEIRICNIADFHPGFREKGDITDYFTEVADYDCGKTVDLINEMYDSVPLFFPEKSEGIIFRSANTFEDREVRFLWNPQIPIGKYTVLMAPGSSGKTTLCCGIAACVTTGTRLPGDRNKEPLPPSRVLIISNEDDGFLLKGKLKESGADLSLVGILEADESHKINLDSGFDAFSRAVLEYRPALVIIDPWHAFIGTEVNMNSTTDVRAILARINLLAARAECGIILISHMNKKAQSDNINYGALGSVDLTSAARSCLTIYTYRGAGKKGYRAAVHTKSNYAKEGVSLMYTMTEKGGLRWAGFSDVTKEILEDAARYHMTAEEYLQRKDSEDTVMDDLVQAIRSYAEPGKTVNVSYAQMKDEFGDGIFGSYQPKKALEQLRYQLREKGIELVLGKTVRYGDKVQNGFSVTKTAASAEEEAD